MKQPQTLPIDPNAPLAVGLHAVVRRRATDKSVRALPTTAKLVAGQVVVENKTCGIIFSFPAAVWPDNTMSAHQRMWVERLTPWWDMEQPQWSPTSHRLRESAVKAINKLFECGAAAPETANIRPEADASTSNGEGERAHRSALKSPNS